MQTQPLDFSRQFLSALAFLVLGFISSATAQSSYNAASDFGNINPSGAWSFGYVDSPGTALTLFDDFETVSFEARWRDTAVDEYLGVYQNISGETLALGTWPDGGVALLPGPSSQYAVLRFTAPIAGDYDISAQFFSGQIGDTTAQILFNGDAGSPLLSVDSTNTNPSYNGTIFLAPGDFVDFMVGQKDGNNSNRLTPINVVITVPEPSVSTMLIGAGMIAFACRRRFRKGGCE